MDECMRRDSRGTARSIGRGRHWACGPSKPGNLATWQTTLGWQALASPQGTASFRMKLSADATPGNADNGCPNRQTGKVDDRQQSTSYVRTYALNQGNKALSSCGKRHGTSGEVSNIEPTASPPHRRIAAASAASRLPARPPSIKAKTRRHCFPLAASSRRRWQA